jgi:hypothetical protein
MSHSHDIKSAENAPPGPGPHRHRRLRLNYEIDSELAYETARYCLIDTLGCGFRRRSNTRPAPSCWARRPGATMPTARACPALLRARSGAGGLQHRRHDPLARLQRHLARRRVGPPVRQSRRHPRRRRLPRPQGGRKASPLTMRDVLTAMIKAHEIQGCSRWRTPSTASASTTSAGARSRPRPSSPRCSGLARADHQRRLERLGRRPKPAHLSPRAQHRLAQELGRRRRHQPRRAPRAHRPDRRDGLSLACSPQKTWGFYDVLQGQAVQASSGPTAAT